MTITGKNLIAGQWSGETQHGFVAFDAIENVALTTHFADATSTEIDCAINAAQSAFMTYSQLSAAHRATFLRTIAEQILALAMSLLKTHVQKQAYLLREFKVSVDAQSGN